MKKIELVCVGGLKFEELKKIEKKYLQKINFFVKFTVKNLKQLKLSDEELLKKREAEMICGVLDKGDFVVSLDPGGEQMNSVEFAGFLEDKLSYYPGRIVFLIGGFAGLSKTLDEKINFKLSFSAMTFSHDIFRIVFLEQLYRSFTIMKGIKYHR